MYAAGHRGGRVSLAGHGFLPAVTDTRLTGFVPETLILFSFPADDMKALPASKTGVEVADLV